MEVRSIEGREDVRGLVESHGRAWREAYEGIVPDDVLAGTTVAPTDEELDEWDDHYRDREGVLVADVDGRVRGYAVFRWGEDTKAFVGPDEAGLKEIYVHPEYWGEGIGTALLEAGLDLLPEDATALRLETLAENDRGRAFYESRGFERTGTVATELGDRSLDSVVYTREL